ncbi:hypothetical protein G7059_01815 [Erysipelothrix sp. HDW6A]|uniref:phage tail tube protein n=1 Tax=Erysipelothrix sp. HDW6A TaxID=2714928 RepID=UPI00140AAF04|nr:hypothetical protein [Erysipelothrix sp. HDW6A]QIK56670.1 hypothetical protein G7059_01815 [Erysipelothrix sp. HDW6A]
MSIKAIMREQSTNFLNTKPTGTTPTYALMNKGIESSAVAYNATVNTRHYVADKNATQGVTGFAKQLDVTQFAYKGDACFEYIDDLIYNDAKGSDAETEMLRVFNYRATTEGATTGIPAHLQPVIIQIDSHGGDGGDQLQIGYNVLFNGDPVKGTVSLVDGVPTFTPEGQEG